jgi:hypothetical protein
LTIIWAFVIRRLHTLLDDVEGLPTAQHVGLGGDVFAIAC